jgi:hypothetical protein
VGVTRKLAYRAHVPGGELEEPNQTAPSSAGRAGGRIISE